MEPLDLFLLLVATTAALYGYIHYGRQIPSRRLKPRPFTWLIWGILGTCVSIIQLNNGADLGTVGALLGAVSGYVLAAMSWHYGKRKIYPADVVSLLLAGVMLAAWAFIGDAATAIAATMIYLIGFTPTVIRAWHAPHKEGRAPFVMAVLKYVISFMLLGAVSIETAVYPVVLAAANFAFLVMLAIRRYQKHFKSTRRQPRSRRLATQPARR